MIELVAQLKARYGLKIAVVSNEARELNAYRIRKFKLDKVVDSFSSSCFVHIRKPDANIHVRGYKEEDTIDRVPRQYIEKHGEDLPEIRNWKWGEER